MNRFAATCLSLSILMSTPHWACAETPAGKQQIEGVIETFRKAIIDKDKESFLKLFTSENITWSGVLPDASIQVLYASRPKPEMPPPHKVFSSNPREFIDFIARHPGRIEETFANVRIDSDGDVAQVWFDYAFIYGDYKQNWGKESWQMVRTETGWKIAAVVWSQEINPVPPPKTGAK